ncbi:hypothetical protein UPYG_G00188230 [Umbra pygmaea]|uniref:Centrosomal protein of 78 kDa n=1 Tax=Umbra pygmaea TaxID=75934 RepID=A0ABD0WS89_UMBPY
MLDSVQIRRRGAQDFEAYYDYACAIQDSVPLPTVKANLSQGMLAFNGDRIRLTDWTPILSSLTINKQLQHVAVSSCYQSGLSIGEPERYRSGFRKKIPVIRSKEMTFKLCKTLRDCLTISPNLKTLQLHGLLLRERDLITLTKGLAKSVSLENLSLAHCPIADEGLEVICQSVKYSSSIKTVDFTGCNLTWRGAEHMANIIKHQAMRRHSAAWAESLRYRKPEFEGMGGLRRVTLNCNTLVGDRGAAALAKELAEDFWVKAMDLQKCGLSNKGTLSLLEALKSNTSLCVLDVRRNPLVDNDLVKTVIQRVLTNGPSSQYSWIKPTAPKDSQKVPGLKRKILGHTARGKATCRMGPRKLSSASREIPGVPQQTHPSRHIPWRTAERAGRQRQTPLDTVAEQSFERAAIVQVTVETESEEQDECSETKSPSAQSLQDRITVRQYKRLQVELEECRLRLAEERRARMKADTRLMEYELENAQLRRVNFSLSEALQDQSRGSCSVLEDDAVLDSIENSFSKFHAFLDLLKDAGMGQLASMAGIDHSDFGPLGRPQLCSTIGTGAGVQDAGEKVDLAPDRPNEPIVASEGQTNACSPGGLATLRGFSSEGEPRAASLIPATDRASDSCVENPAGENQPTDKAPSQPVSGSHHVTRSNGFHGNGSCAKSSYSSGSQTSASIGKGSCSGNVSHHINGKGSKHSKLSIHSNDSHGYSFNYSNDSHANSSIHSDSSHSNDWHGDGSVRSSVSGEIERVESVGSLASISSRVGRAQSLSRGRLFTIKKAFRAQQLSAKLQQQKRLQAMGGLGNGRRGVRSPPLLIGALIACILVLGFNYWVSNSRNLELQTKLYELEAQVRRVASERGAEEVKKNEFQEEIQRLKDESSRMQSLNKKLEGIQSFCSQEKASQQKNISSSIQTIQNLKSQLNVLNADLGKTQKEFKNCQGNLNTLNKKLTYDMTQCNTQILAQREECAEMVAAAKKEVQKKLQQSNVVVVSQNISNQMQKVGPTVTVRKPHKDSGPGRTGLDDTKTSSVNGHAPESSVTNGPIVDFKASELETNEIVADKGTLPVPNAKAAKPGTVEGASDPPNRNLTESMEVMEARGGEPNLEEVLSDADDIHLSQAKEVEALIGQKVKDPEEDYDADEQIVGGVGLDKRNQMAENIDKEAEREMQEELADYNGDDENEGESEADKQMALAQF